MNKTIPNGSHEHVSKQKISFVFFIIYYYRYALISPK